MRPKVREWERLCCGRSCWAEARSIQALVKSQVILDLYGFLLYGWDLRRLATASLRSNQIFIAVCMISITVSVSGVLVGYYVIQSKEQRRKVFAWWATNAIVNLIWGILAANFYSPADSLTPLHSRISAAVNGVSYVLARLHMNHLDR